MGFRVNEFELWDVVNVPAFPNQEQSSETTGRPAIILEDLENSVIIIPVTKQINQASRYQFILIIEKDTPEAKAMGLTYTSMLIIDRAFTLNKIRLTNVIGKCPDSVINKIEEMITKAKNTGFKI